LVLVGMYITCGICSAQPVATDAGIPLDKQWKVEIYTFAKDHLQHSAWGVPHYERDYLLAQNIAYTEKIALDDDVLFAAAFLHDIGVFEPYKKDGAEHSETAAENVADILQASRFPMSKLKDVQTTIRAHMYYAEVPAYQTARVFHDADTLDFLGSIGIARILSITTRESWAATLSAALATIKKFNTDLPATLSFDSSKEIAAVRVKEVSAFIASINKESHDGNAL